MEDITNEFIGFMWVPSEQGGGETAKLSSLSRLAKQHQIARLPIGDLAFLLKIHKLKGPWSTILHQSVCQNHEIIIKSHENPPCVVKKNTKAKNIHFDYYYGMIHQQLILTSGSQTF